MVTSGDENADGSMVLYKRDTGSYERPKNIWSRAQALRKRIRYARRHFP